MSSDEAPGARGAAVRRAAAAQVFVGDLAALTLGEAQAHHLGRVLRLRAGEPVVAADGNGAWRLCRYHGEDRLEPDGGVRCEPRPMPAVTVAFAPPKGDRPEWVVQKLTEVGVDRIVVLRTGRSVVRWDARRERSAMGRLEKVVIEAAAQSRRVWLPELSGVVGLDALARESIALAEPEGALLGPWVNGVAIGPEGGWSDAERALGLPTAALGDGVLRTETAAIVAGVLLCAHRAGTVWPD